PPKDAVRDPRRGQFAGSASVPGSTVSSAPAPSAPASSGAFGSGSGWPASGLTDREGNAVSETSVASIAPSSSKSDQSFTCASGYTFQPARPATSPLGTT